MLLLSTNQFQWLELCKDKSSSLLLALISLIYLLSEPILSVVSPLYFITCFTAGMEHFPSETNLENPAISMQIFRKFPFYHTLEIF